MNQSVYLRQEEEVRFEGNYRGRGKWYPGKVNLDRGDKTSFKGFCQKFQTTYIWMLCWNVAAYPSDTPENRIEPLTNILEMANDDDSF